MPVLGRLAGVRVAHAWHVNACVRVTKINTRSITNQAIKKAKPRKNNAVCDGPVEGAAHLGLVLGVAGEGPQLGGAVGKLRGEAVVGLCHPVEGVCGQRYITNAGKVKQYFKVRKCQFVNKV